MPRPGTQCDNCSHGPLEKCKQDCRIKEIAEHFQKFAAGLPAYDADWCIIGRIARKALEEGSDG